MFSVDKIRDNAARSPARPIPAAAAARRQHFRRQQFFHRHLRHVVAGNLRRSPPRPRKFEQQLRRRGCYACHCFLLSPSAFCFLPSPIARRQAVDFLSRPLLRHAHQQTIRHFRIPLPPAARRRNNRSPCASASNCSTFSVVSRTTNSLNTGRLNRRRQPIARPSAFRVA